MGRRQFLGTFGKASVGVVLVLNRLELTVLASESVGDGYEVYDSSGTLTDAGLASSEVTANQALVTAAGAAAGLQVGDRCIWKITVTVTPPTNTVPDTYRAFGDNVELFSVNAEAELLKYSGMQGNAAQYVGTGYKVSPSSPGPGALPAQVSINIAASGNTDITVTKNTTNTNESASWVISLEANGDASKEMSVTGKASYNGASANKTVTAKFKRHPHS